MKKLITMLAVLAGLSMFSVYAQEEVAPISEEVATEQVEKTERKPRKANEKRQPRQRQPKLYEECKTSVWFLWFITRRAYN